MKSKKPAIVYIITKLELGGAQKVCLELFNHFAPNSYLISSPDGVLVELVKDNPHFFPIKYLQRDASVFGVFRELFALVQIFLILRRLKSEHLELVVHTHSSKAGILGRVAAYCAGVKKIVHTVHGFGMTSDQGIIFSLIFRMLEQVGTFLATNIICVSKRDLDTGGRLFWGFAEKASIIRAAIDEKPFLDLREEAKLCRQRNSLENKIIVGTVSCFKPQKNLLDLIKSFYLACKLLGPRSLQFELEIVGDGEMRIEIEERIARYQLKNKIKLLGWRSDVAPLMAAWDVFALTSLWEGLPCSLVQAQILGQVAVCYDTGGVPEILKNNQNGYLIEQKNIFLFSLGLLKAIEINKDNVVFGKLDYFLLDKMLVDYGKIYA